MTGMAGGMGAAFTSRLFAAILTSELAPTKKSSYVAAFIPALADRCGICVESHPLLSGAVGGVMVGLIAFALPLAAISGNSQLMTILQDSATFGVTFPIAVLLAKMLALAFCQAARFLGGFVFPLIFVGGTAGVLVSNVFPGIPIELAVGCLPAAVAGAILAAPVSLILIAAGTVSIAPTALAAICIAVVISHASPAFVRGYVVSEKQLKTQQPD